MMGRSIFRKSLAVMRRLVFQMALPVLVLGTGLPAAANTDIPGGTAGNSRGTAAVIRDLSEFGDRTTGSRGATEAARYIGTVFRSLGFETTGTHDFLIPVRNGRSAFIIKGAGGEPQAIDCFVGNGISPDSLAEPGIDGHLIYAGAGRLRDFNGMDVKGAVVLMELDSATNWVHAFSLGAKAVIYIRRGAAERFLFEDKFELTPVVFPRFVMDADRVRDLFGDIDTAGGNALPPRVRLVSDLGWQQVLGENIFCMVPGKSPALANELVVVEGFYDTSMFIAGRSPGADQACSIATLLDLARFFRTHPPDRSVLLVATSGHAQALAGMRETIWSIHEKSTVMKEEKKRLERIRRDVSTTIAALEQFQAGKDLPPDLEAAALEGLGEAVKARVETITGRLMALRLMEKSPDTGETIKTLARSRLVLRQLLWKSTLTGLARDEHLLAGSLVPDALKRMSGKSADAARQLEVLNTAMEFHDLVGEKQLQAVVSLHLSSHGDGVGAFSSGWLYDLKQGGNRFAPYSRLDQVLAEAGAAMEKDPDLAGLYQDTLRPSYRHSWQSYFLDTPFLGGEVSSLAGYLGITLATTNDARRFWGTPDDRPDTVDEAYLARQSRCVSTLVSGIASAETLISGSLPDDGFATLKVRANFIRHGELFAEAPAPGSILMAFQGAGLYHQQVDETGIARIKGLATKKRVLDKVIIEGYRFEEGTGKTIWAIDKKKTAKDGYRVKMNKGSVETDLVMFPCRQTTLVNLLEPRTFRYMTRINILDGRLDADPVRYWYSRIDTRSSTLNSIYLESGTRLKLTLSDTLLTHRLILTGSDPENAQGTGYLIDDHPLLAPTGFLGARDMWALLNPRIENLETRGIHSSRIIGLQEQGNAALTKAEAHLEHRQYDAFYKWAGIALALAGRVYDHVEKTQKDVLFGVLFYIALFVPFAFCMERFLFGYASIYRRISAFFCILALLIGIIYKVHPAFELAYSPVVVILAFFIMALSVMVSWIVVSRFEEEIQNLRRRGVSFRHEEIGLFKAFMASFFMGINNLRRHRLRTVLTCFTLIVVTFTVMSFTSVKTVRQHSRLDYGDQAPYPGILVKQLNWKAIPNEAFASLDAFHEPGIKAAPRAWMESHSAAEPVKIPVTTARARSEALGIVGLSSHEPDVSGMDRILVHGRWLNADDWNTVLVSERLARQLGISLDDPGHSVLSLWSIPFTVVGIFSGDAADGFLDLDGESLSPVIFPDEVMPQTTEVEMEAMESGDDVKSFQSRYRHVPFDQVLVIPFDRLVSMGGRLKSIALGVPSDKALSGLVTGMLDRFGLWLFAGSSRGVSLYTASDSLSYGGLPNVLVPVLISMLIVLNTMISSVHERKREIGIYTSVGMAPYHVAILFMAEALAYAVLSVVLGYVLAQTSVKLFGHTSFFQGITVNYSSVAGVAAMAMVILVVGLSSIYPARMASTIAIPDVEKTWALSKPRGNDLAVDLPFLLAPGEDRSAAGYLWHFLSSHREVSHGLFSVADLSWTSSGTHERSAPAAMDDSSQGVLGFTAWLAPFDFGIMQAVNIRFARSGLQDGYLGISMTVTRQSGEANAWWRINRRFVNLMRKQLLIWRSMDAKGKQRFDDAFFAREHVRGDAHV